MSRRAAGRGDPHARVRRGSEEVSAWRARRLRAAGFEPSLAVEIASDLRFDLHALLELRDRGCPAQLAARITAPIETGRQP